MLRFLKRENNIQYEFLPAALEIAETPPSPLGRIVIWLIFLILMAAILWACIGKVDEVAVARGKVIPDGRLKVVQSLEEGIITAIHVNEGQRVKEGQLLIELDSTIKKVDVETLQKAIDTEKLERDLLKKALDGGNVQELVSKADLPDEIKNNLLKLMQSKDSEYLVKKQSLALVVRQCEEQLKIDQSDLQKLENNLFMINEKELSTQKIRVELDKSKLEEAKNNMDNLEKERNTATLNLVVEKDKKITELEGELTKAKKSVQFQSLEASVDGTVHGLVSNTIGGIVTPAQTIMTIVPDGTPLIIEASLLNRDIGFVEVGQEAEIKIDTFPFQKYGTIKGKVESISPDAFEDEKMGSVYKMKVSLEKSEIMVNGKEVHISPGMAVSAEIKTGKRRIIEFFLEPIIKYAEESLKLR